LTEPEALPINSVMANPAGRRRGVFAWLKPPVNPSLNSRRGARVAKGDGL
jgi:hypothetical protein